MPKLKKNPSPRELYKVYREGFKGSVRDPEGLDRLLGQLPHPLFGAASTRKDSKGKIITLDGSGEGKTTLLYPSREVFDPGAFAQEKQVQGDCVAHAVRNAVDTTRTVEIHVKGDSEGYVARGATEPIYGCRGHGGEGMSCSEAAAWVNKRGGYLLRLPYENLNIDLSKYGGLLGAKWGRRGVPDNVNVEARKHQVQTISLITSIEEARDAITNGYAIAVCSSQGFSSKRDSEGFANPKGSWSHGMAWTAVDDNKKRPGILIQNCFSDDTEIMTESGWCLFKDLKEGQKVATLNKETKNLEFQIPTEYQDFPYEGDMLHFQGQYKDCLVTPEHNMLYQSKWHREVDKPILDFKKAKDVTKSDIFYRYAENYTEGTAQETIEICGYTVSMDDWLEFLGYFLSEGWATIRVRERTRSKSRVAVVEEDGYSGICQQPGPILEHMEEIIARLPWKFSTRKKASKANCYSLVCYEKEFARYLSQFGKAHEKFIPEYVFKLPRNQQRLLFKTLMSGDGKPDGSGYHTTSPKLRDDFQRLTIMQGYASDHYISDKAKKDTHHDLHRVSVQQKDRTKGSSKVVLAGIPETVKYKGNVYCVTVPNHTIITRRNGKTLVTGQSWGRWNSGPKRLNQPDGSFWVEYDVAAKMLRQRGAWVFSSFDGFPPQKVPNYLTGVL